MSETPRITFDGTLRPTFTMDNLDEHSIVVAESPTPDVANFRWCDRETETVKLHIADWKVPDVWVDVMLDLEKLRMLDAPNTRRWSAEQLSLTARGNVYVTTLMGDMFSSVQRNVNGIIDNVKVLDYDKLTRTVCIDIVDSHAPAAWVQATFSMDDLEHWMRARVA